MVSAALDFKICKLVAIDGSEGTYISVANSGPEIKKIKKIKRSQGGIFLTNGGGGCHAASFFG